MGVCIRMAEIKLNHLNRQFKSNGKYLGEHCPVCFNTISFISDKEGNWIYVKGCCHLRSITKEDGKYIGHFSYELGCFEGIKDAVN